MKYSLAVTLLLANSASAQDAVDEVSAEDSANAYMDEQLRMAEEAIPS